MNEGAQGGPPVIVWFRQDLRRKFWSYLLWHHPHMPELERVPDRFVHAPWTAPPTVLAEAGLELGRSYPHAIADLPQARQRALDVCRATVRRAA